MGDLPLEAGLRTHITLSSTLREILIFRYAIDSIEKKTEVNTADRNDTEALNCYFTAKTFHKSRRLFYFFVSLPSLINDYLI